ncbi:MAG: helix-turn-helix domain-containing protein [Mycobacterium sp.]
MQPVLPVRVTPAAAFGRFGSVVDERADRLGKMFGLSGGTDVVSAARALIVSGDDIAHQVSGVAAAAAARRLFREHGYQGTALSDVVTESAAARGSVYFHFPDTPHHRNPPCAATTPR